MSVRQFPELSKLPLVGHIFRSGSSTHQRHDDDQALLDDDALGIPLESNESTLGSPVQQPRLAARSYQHAGSMRNRSCQFAIFFAILGGLLLAILLPRRYSTPKNDGLLPCGNSRYSINEVSVFHPHGLGAFLRGISIHVIAAIFSVRLSIESGHCNVATIAIYPTNIRKSSLGTLFVILLTI